MQRKEDDDFSHAVWFSVLQKFGVDWVMPSTVAELSFDWDIALVSPKFSSLWLLTFFATMWSQLWEHNNRIFKDRAQSSYAVSTRVFAKSASWASTLLNFRNIPTNDILRV